MMSPLSDANPTGRFSGLAEVYAKCRPDYPAEAVDFILARCGLAPGARLVDVGSGTGISARLFARRRQEVDLQGLLGRAFSASYAPREPDRAEKFAADLVDVYYRFQRDGQVVICYETTVYTGRARARGEFRL